jgi:hypothetical protein
MEEELARGVLIGHGRAAVAEALERRSTMDKLTVPHDHKRILLYFAVLAGGLALWAAMALFLGQAF